MLTDDFVRRIALDALGARIPVGDAPLCIQHVDGVVAHALHEHSEPLLAVTERFLLFALRSDIARDLGEADMPALRVEDGIEDRVRPEAAAVLANAPALRLETPLGQSELQSSLRKAGFTVFGREEDREVLTDDFVGGVALEPLGAWIPRRDPAGLVEHVDRVIRDRIDEQLEPLLLRETVQIRQYAVVLTLRRSAPVLAHPTEDPLVCKYFPSNSIPPPPGLRTGQEAGRRSPLRFQSSFPESELRAPALGGSSRSRAPSDARRR